jgi:hypothetical protein
MPVSVSILDGIEQQDARTTSPATPAEPPIGQMPMKSLPSICGKSDIVLASTKIGGNWNESNQFKDNQREIKKSTSQSLSGYVYDNPDKTVREKY